jgi:hypothetical protein
MMKKGPGGPRITFGPQARDFVYLPEPLRRRKAKRPTDEPSDGVPPPIGEENTARLLQNLRGDGFSLTPEPRIPGKHALNPPIVTIFGAGVAGMTAAHELVDRGFLVQVVEAAEDPYCPGRPHVGGLAANQPARVRANVEDLHRALVASALTPPPEGAPANDVARWRVAAWLLKVFAFNRSRWIQTEKPARIHTSLFAQDREDSSAFRKSLLKDLKEARLQYRERWLWDLSVRAVMLGIIKPKNPENPKASPLEIARDVFEHLAKPNLPTLDLAHIILEYRLASHTTAAELPEAQELDACADMVEAAFEREFLCFRLVPYTRAGFAVSVEQVLELHDEWATTISKEKDLRHACLSTPSDEDAEKGAKQAKPSKVRRGRDGVPIAVRTADASPDSPHVAWLEIEIVEQRLPGEHGYRFFPSFYRHLDDTMGRIPLYANGLPTGRTVRDNLQPTVFQGVGLSTDDRKKMGDVADDADPAPAACKPQTSATVIELARKRPQSFEALRECTDRFVKRLGGTPQDSVLLLAKLTRYITASPERRRAKYEGVTWEKFLGADRFSEQMRFQIRSAAQALLAFSAAEADARTYGNIAVQMLLDELRDGARVDRTLNGPTSDAWLEPWREHLERQGVRFFRGALKSLVPSVVDGKVELVPELEILGRDMLSPQVMPLLTHDLAEPALQPDFYVLALNVEQSRRLVADLPAAIEELLKANPGVPKFQLADLAPDLAGLATFGQTIDQSGAMREMTGIQYFFDAKTDIGRGHMYFPYSRWGLSSITQSEFWSARGGFADGYFGLLSVDVCTTGKLQEGTTPEKDYDVTFFDSLKGWKRPEEGCLQTARAALRQITSRLVATEQVSAPRCFHVDSTLFPAKAPPEGEPARLDPNEPKPRFLASLVGLDETRPGRRGGCVGPKEVEYGLGFRRWVLCGTFMATHTRMTTMESANESARHAVAAILRRLQQPDTSETVREILVDGLGYQIENLENNTYNWASAHRAYEAPETWNPEDDELDDLDFFRRVDRRLMDLGLDHFMDIVKFDEKLEHALETIKLYGDRAAFEPFFGAGLAGLDAALTRELGQGYLKREEDRLLKGPLAPRASANTTFADLNTLDARWSKLLEEMAKLIRRDRPAAAAAAE